MAALYVRETRIRVGTNEGDHRVGTNWSEELDVKGVGINDHVKAYLEMNLTGMWHWSRLRIGIHLKQVQLSKLEETFYDNFQKPQQQWWFFKKGKFTFISKKKLLCEWKIVHF